MRCFAITHTWCLFAVERKCLKKATKQSGLMSPDMETVICVQSGATCMQTKRIDASPSFMCTRHTQTDTPVIWMVFGPSFHFHFHFSMCHTTDFKPHTSICSISTVQKRTRHCFFLFLCTVYTVYCFNWVWLVGWFVFVLRFLSHFHELHHVLASFYSICINLRIIAMNELACRMLHDDGFRFG